MQAVTASGRRARLAIALFVALLAPGLAFAPTAKEQEREARIAQLEARVQALIGAQRQQQASIVDTKAQLDQVKVAQAAPADGKPKIQSSPILGAGNPDGRFSDGGFIKVDAMVTDTSEGEIAGFIAWRHVFDPTLRGNQVVSRAQFDNDPDWTGFRESRRGRERAVNHGHGQLRQGPDLRDQLRHGADVRHRRPAAHPDALPQRPERQGSPQVGVLGHHLDRRLLRPGAVLDVRRVLPSPDPGAGPHVAVRCASLYSGVPGDARAMNSHLISATGFASGEAQDSANPGRPGEAAVVTLLDRQRRALEMVVRGEPLPQVLEEICRIIEAVAPDRVAAAISLVEDARLVHGAAPSLSHEYNALIDGVPVDPDVGTCPVAAATRRIVITEDIASEPRWAPFAAHPLADGWRAVWSMPILGAGGEVIATIGTYFKASRAPTSVEMELVGALAGTAALAIERTRADEGIRRQNARNVFLATLEASIRNLEEPGAIIELAASRLGEFLAADRCAYATAEAGDQLVVRGSYSRHLPPVDGSWPLDAFGAGFSQALLQGQTHVVCDSETDLAIDPSIRDAFLATEVRAAITVPLLKADRLSAVISVHQAAPRRWKADELDVAEQVVARCWEAVERTRVTAALRSSEARFRAIVQSTPECVKLVARDGHVLQMNDAGLRMVGADRPGDVVGRNVFNLIAPEFRTAYRALHEQVCQGESRSLEYELIGLDGMRRWVSTTAVPMAMPGGETAHLAVTRDVTARVAADAALADSHARLDYAVRLSGIGFWYCDLPFDELKWDARAKAHFWLPPDARVTIDTFFERIHPDDREATRAAIALSNESGAPYDVYYRTCEPDGDGVKWIRALGGTTFEPNGQPIRFDGVTVDVTAQKSSEAESRRIAVRLQDADRRKDDFLAMLAHELRNPLAPIATAAQLVKRASDQPERTAHAADIIERQVAHLTTLVDDLLDVSRVTRGLVEIERTRVDLRSVVGAALEQVQPLLRAREHELRTVFSASDAFVEGDFHRLVQVLANLLTNAAKYTPPQGVITLEAGTSNGQVTLKVSDNGVGIAADLLDAVFELFTQAERTPDRTQGGLGIGLALVRSLVDLHGGTVAAHSDGPNRGSTFTVRLPCSPEAELSRDASPAAPADPVSMRPRRVLVVDDNHDAAATLAALLQLVGHTVSIATDAASALAEAARGDWDAYVLDIGLPDMTGFELAQKLRDGPARPLATFIALTGYGQPHDRVMSRGAGFDHHMVKPPEIPRLLAILGGG